MSTEIIKQQDGSYQIKRDGYSLECPFRSPVALPIQTALGQHQIVPVSTPCSSKCPHFDYTYLTGIPRITISLNCVNPKTQITVDTSKETVK